MNTSNIKNEELTALHVMDYFVALFELGSNFTATGEDILRYPGYRDLHWATSLLSAMRPAARLFAGDHFDPKQKEQMKILRVLSSAPEEEVNALLTREIVAVFCAADNILATMYHEYIAQRYSTKLEAIAQPSKEDRMRVRRLRNVSAKFGRLKKAFLWVAFGNSLDAKRKAQFDISVISSQSSVLHDAIMAAPVVYRYCPRYLTSDWSQITKLRQKYRDMIIECEQEVIRLDLDFEFNANGKF